VTAAPTWHGNAGKQRERQPDNARQLTLPWVQFVDQDCYKNQVIEAKSL
jgi:hypothetical protein